MVAAATETARYRSEWRSTGVGPRYSGWAHLAFTSLSCWAGIAFAISRIRHPSWAELATFPLGFLIANAAEYFGHRGPMHRPRWPLETIFRRHAVEHHQFFTHREMAYETSRDFKMVLFPPVMILFFMGGMATPIAVAFYFLVSPNTGWIFAATGVGYFLTYEWLHFAYHFPSETPLGRLKVVSLLRQHHSVHHNPALMSRWNFNITFPICDRIFGTIHPEKPIVSSEDRFSNSSSP